MRKKGTNITKGYKMWSTEVSLLSYECQWTFWKRMQTFLRETLRENSGKKTRTLQCSSGLDQAEDVLINQFDYFMSLCIRGSRIVANNKEIVIKSISESINTSELLPEMGV